MQPIIGTIVHYQSYGTPRGEYDSEPRAAVVTELHPDNYVGLCVLNPTGMFFHRSVPFSETPMSGHWNWPPLTEA